LLVAPIVEIGFVSAKLSSLVVLAANVVAVVFHFRFVLVSKRTG
jgi:hypothetical protein